MTLRTGGMWHGTFACHDQKALLEAFAIFRQRFSAGFFEPDRVRGTPEAQRYLGIGCLPVSRDDGLFEITAYDDVGKCQIQSSTIKRPVWVLCDFLQTPTGEVLGGRP